MSRALQLAFRVLWSLCGPAKVLARTQLPQPDPPFRCVVKETYDQSTPDYPKPLRAKPGSPNVLLILLDDVGFGMCSTLGGPVPTPTCVAADGEGQGTAAPLFRRLGRLGKL